MSQPGVPGASRRARRPLGLLVGALLVCGCSARDGSQAAARSDAPPTAPTGQAAAPSPELPGIEHYHRWSAHLGQGSQPQGEASFAALAAQGFGTILSVDGAIPDVEGAARHGLAYVHVPIGYDGIEPEEQLQIVKAVASSDAPVFVHCHHGLHRGPAAAAIARIATDGVTPDEAYQGLKQSGCSPDYAGLYRDVAAFTVPDPSVIAALDPPPSQVRPEGTRGAMVAVDGLWGMLKACKAAGWTTPPAHPDVEPAHEALMLAEQLREMARLEQVRAKGDDFLQRLAEGERLAGELSATLRAGDGASAADAVHASLKQSCKACHVDYRD